MRKRSSQVQELYPGLPDDIPSGISEDELGRVLFERWGESMEAEGKTKDQRYYGQRALNRAYEGWDESQSDEEILAKVRRQHPKSAAGKPFADLFLYRLRKERRLNAEWRAEQEASKAKERNSNDMQ